jgi:hypothetical protein
MDCADGLGLFPRIISVLEAATPKTFAELVAAA